MRFHLRLTFNRICLITFFFSFCFLNATDCPNTKYTDSNEGDGTAGEKDDNQPLDLTVKKKRRQGQDASSPSFCHPSLFPDAAPSSFPLFFPVTSSSSGLCQDFKSRQLVSFDRKRDSGHERYRVNGIPSSFPSSGDLVYNLNNLVSSVQDDEDKEYTQTSIKRFIHSVEKSAAQAASIMASVRGRNASESSSSHHHTNDVFLNQVHQQLIQQHIQRNQQQNSNQSHPRTAIKQKLEDAFRENGFLVKTKQVSDGDATFCKFRQLRKYTRYYLKSWHKHLPDEVNKLYKGFLPPKTARSGGGLLNPDSGRRGSSASSTKTPPHE